MNENDKTNQHIKNVYHDDNNNDFIHAYVSVVNSRGWNPLLIGTPKSVYNNIKNLFTNVIIKIMKTE